MPTTAISSSGTILMTVVATWNRPASQGDRALTAKLMHRKKQAMAIQGPPVMSQPNSTQKYRADSQASTEVSVG